MHPRGGALTGTKGPIKDLTLIRSRSARAWCMPGASSASTVITSSRFARTGWRGTHGPRRVCRALSGHALEDGPEAAGPGEVAEDSVEVCGWRREGLADCLQGPRSLCAGTFGAGQGTAPGATVNAGAHAPQEEGVRDEHSDSP